MCPATKRLALRELLGKYSDQFLPLAAGFLFHFTWWVGFVFPRKWFFKQKMSLKDVKNDRAHNLSQAGTALCKASWEVAQVLLVSDDGVAFVPVNLGGNWGGIW